MKGVQIFMHALRMVFGNLGPVLRLSAVLYALLFLAFGSLGFGAIGLESASDDGVSAEAVGQLALGATLAALFGLVAQVWIIVNWHRYVLLEDYPAGWIPRWPGFAVFRYMGRAILLGLVIALIMIPALILVGGAMALSQGLGVVLVSGLAALGSYLFFRLGIVLPAAAIGEPLTFREAWTATKDPDGAVIVLVFVVVAGGLFLQLPILLFDSIGASILSGAAALVAGWINTMVGASLLTTLFGHYVQGRGVD